jgi:hypothetical protein
VSGKESLSELMGAHRYRRSTLVVISMVASITRGLEDKKGVVGMTKGSKCKIVNEQERARNTDSETMGSGGSRRSTHVVVSTYT